MGLCLSRPADGWAEEGRAGRNPHFVKSFRDPYNLAFDPTGAGMEAASEEALTILLVGAADSGKSTLFKQLQGLYGTGDVFNAQTLLPYKYMVYLETLISMKTLILESSKLGKTLPAAHWKKLSSDAVEAVEGTDDLSSLSPELARHMKRLWADSGIKQTFELRSKFQLNDECSWFFNRLDEMVKPDYVPSFEDVLRLGSRTKGFPETVIRVNKQMFRLLDVGGSRNERRKWYHRFESARVILFVAAINEFDQNLKEDPSVNRLEEALALWSQICNSRWFAHKTIILFLNKKDLFRDKVSKSADFAKQFPEYKGSPHDYNAALQFMRSMFEEQNEHPTKTIFTHVTSAIDAGDVQANFEMVKTVVLSQSVNTLRV
jgi:GTPase SAR1 family protein